MGEGKEITTPTSKVGDHNKANVCSGNSKKRECRVMFKVYFIVRLLFITTPKVPGNPSFFSSIKASMTNTLPRGGYFLFLLLSTAKAKAQFHGCSLLDNPHLSLYYTYNELVHYFYICILRVPLSLLAPE